MSPERILTERAREMFAIIERYRESGLTQKRFCQSEGLSLSTFYYWVSRYKQYHTSPLQHNSGHLSSEQSPNAFIELKPQLHTAAANNAIILTYPNGVTLSLSDSTIDLAGLKALITLGLD